MADGSKTGLTKYARKGSTRNAYAGRVTSVQPYIRGAMTLHFGDIDKRMHVVAEWVAKNNPQTGGYVVIEDSDGPTPNCYFSAASAFEADFKEVA